MDRCRVGQAGEPRLGERDDNATSICVGVRSRHQAITDEPVDSARHARARAVGPGREVAHAQFPARLRKLRQDVEIAEREPDLVDEMRCQLAHERGVRTEQRTPGVETSLIRDRLRDDAPEKRRGVGLVR